MADDIALGALHAQVIQTRLLGAELDRDFPTGAHYQGLGHDQATRGIQQVEVQARAGRGRRQLQRYPPPGQVGSDRQGRGLRRVLRGRDQGRAELDDPVVLIIEDAGP